MNFAWHIISEGRKIASFVYERDAIMCRDMLQEEYSDCEFLIEHLEDA
jgi:hypothetical protein